MNGESWENCLKNTIPKRKFEELSALEEEKPKEKSELEEEEKKE